MDPERMHIYRCPVGSPADFLDGLLAVVFAESLTVLKSLAEDFAQLVVVILRVVLSLAMLQ